MATAKLMYGTRFSDDRAELMYLVTGTSDAGDARDAVLAEAPATFEGIDRDDVEVTEILDVDDHWRGFVRYQDPTSTSARSQRSSGASNLDNVGDEVFDFSTSGATAHIVQSIATRDSDAVAGTATDHKGAIGVSGTDATRSVAGVDIVIPQFTFSITKVIVNASISLAFWQMLYDLTGKVNDANENFGGLTFNAGEVLFLGATGSKRGNGDWEITFLFSAIPNDATYDAGFGMTVNKLGWDYVWVYYEPAEDGAANRTATRPAMVYSEKVYNTEDFSRLPV